MLRVVEKRLLAADNAHFTERGHEAPAHLAAVVERETDELRARAVPAVGQRVVGGVDDHAEVAHGDQRIVAVADISDCARARVDAH